MGDDLDEAALLLVDDRAAVAGHQVLALFDRDALGLGLVLGDADRSDLRVGVDAAGDGVQVDRRLLAGDDVRRADALCTRHVGQLDPGGDIADGIDALNAGAEGFVGDDPSALAGYLKADGKQSLRIGAAADGDQNLLGRDTLGLSFFGKAADQLSVLLLDLLDHRAGVDCNPALFEQHIEALRNFAVHRRQDALHRLHDGHLAA